MRSNKVMLVTAEVVVVVVVIVSSSMNSDAIYGWKAPLVVKHWRRDVWWGRSNSLPSIPSMAGGYPPVELQQVQRLKM